MDNELTYLDSLILKGAVEVHGIDKDGQFLYKLADNVDELAPDLAFNLEQSMFVSLMQLWQSGFLSIILDNDGDPTVRLADKAYDDDAIISELNEIDAMTLSIVRKAIDKKYDV